MAIGRKTGGRKIGSVNKTGADVRELARQYTAEAISTLVRIMQNDEHPAQNRAADSLLDRGWGKPPQAHTGEGGTGPVVIQFTTGFAVADDADD
jgi:hypothetical protein